MSLLLDYPDIAKQWNIEKNKDLDISSFKPFSGKKVWWQCPKHPTHEYEAAISDRTNSIKPTGCPFCNSKKSQLIDILNNNIDFVYYDLIKEEKTYEIT
jgi:hypothetical protein